MSAILKPARSASSIGAIAALSASFLLEIATGRWGRISYTYTTPLIYPLCLLATQARSPYRRTTNPRTPGITSRMTAWSATLTHGWAGSAVRSIRVMLDPLTFLPLPTLRGERVMLRGPRSSDVDDRLRHPIDPEEEDGYGSSWRREWDGRRYHTREHLTATSSPHLHLEGRIRRPLHRQRRS
jgi:hypothetical protein